DPFAGTIRLENADREIASRLTGEGDVVATRRPNRSRVVPLAKTDALGRTSGRRHDIDLLRAAAVALETDAAPIRRITRRSIDGRRTRQPRRLFRAQVP